MVYGEHDYQRREEFILRSVDACGPGWTERFGRCLNAAVEVRYATDDAFLGDGLLGPGAVLGFPSTSTWPLSGCSKPCINRSSVVLPQPDGPTRHTNSLG